MHAKVTKLYVFGKAAPFIGEIFSKKILHSNANIYMAVRIAIE
jgi:hypothetical protein